MFDDTAIKLLLLSEIFFKMYYTILKLINLFVKKYV